MKNYRRIAFVLALGFVLTAAPGFAQKVTVDWDLDYTGPIDTYAWVPPQSPAQNPFMHQRIVNAIDYWMTMRGHQEVEQSDNPDVFVTYHTATRDDVVVTSDSYGYGYGVGWRWGGGGMGTTTSRSHTYTEGTLVLDVWNAKEEKNLIFRGTATDTVTDNPEKMEKKINKFVEKIVKEFDKKIEKENKKKKKS